MDALQILASLVTAMLGYAIGYFVKKSEYERQRRDELADRKTEKRSKFRAEKIEDVQDFIHTYMDLSFRLWKLENVMARAKVNDMSIGGLEEILEKMKTTQKYLGSFLALDDQMLSALSTAVVQSFADECAKALDLEEMIRNEQEFDEETVLKRIEDVQAFLTSSLSVMQRKLNELAQTEA